MGVWSVGVVDTGVVDETEASYGANAYEWDFYYGHSDTDGGRTTSHGSLVAQTIEQTNPALERIDLQIAPNSGSFLLLSAGDAAFGRLIGLHDQGWHIGAVNVSWGSSFPYPGYVPEVDALAARGVYLVAASGNAGSHRGFEPSLYPSALGNVISVGSHDGLGNPSGFSNNRPGHVHVLADGENMPGPGISGTSFAAPQVSAGVATVQALADAALERRLTFAETVGVLQQGGGATLSNPDPADGSSRYYLFDHDRSVDYFLRTHLDPQFSGYEYMASYDDIEAAFAGNSAAARAHLISTGVYEGREVAFDGLDYIASYGDLIQAFGANRELGALHYLGSGRGEGRAISFDAESYLAANADLRAAFGTDVAAAARHYITNGYAEGRGSAGQAGGSAPSAVPEADLPGDATTSGYVAVGQSVGGWIASGSDRDWFRTGLTAGQSVVIEARGSAGGGGTLSDPELVLRDLSGRVVAYDMDGGLGRDSRLTYAVSRTGTCYVEVDGYAADQGSYTLSVTAAGSSQLMPAVLAEPLDRSPDGAGSPWWNGYGNSTDGIL